MMAEKYFPDPFKFNPLRFVDDNGKLARNKNWLPFGYGRRSCPGKALAEQQLLQYTLYFLKWVLNIIIFFNFKKLRNCEGFSDEKNPLPAPETESEWHEMFARIPVHDPKTVMMILKNRTMKVKPRVHNWLGLNCKYTDNDKFIIFLCRSANKYQKFMLSYFASQGHALLTKKSFSWQ